MKSKYYLCIDFKSFFASCECVLRGLDPFKTNLIVADASRGKGTICLAASPAIRKLGVKSRCRLYEVPTDIDYIIAKPRLELYMKMSAKIYDIYLRYVAKEDIYVYSIDESFIYLTPYLTLYKKTPTEFAAMLIQVILKETGITSTCGIGTNIYLAKIALDIIAKKDDTNIGFLTQESYIDRLSNHLPLTDFWMIGKGTERRLNSIGIKTLEDVRNAKKTDLEKILGINANYLIDHANGIDDTTIADIKSYTPSSTCISNSQVLFSDYNYHDALIILLEMVDLNVLNLVDNRLVTSSLYLGIGYSKDVIKPLSKSLKLNIKTNSYEIISKHYKELYEANVSKEVPIRKITVSLGNLVLEEYEQLDLFIDEDKIKKERNLNRAITDLKNRFGKNICLRGISYLEKSTARERNKLVGGHNAK